MCGVVYNQPSVPDTFLSDKRSQKRNKKNKNDKELIGICRLDGRQYVPSADATHEGDRTRRTQNARPIVAKVQPLRIRAGLD